MHHAQDRLQFAYQPGVGVEDAILYLLHRIHSHLDKGRGTTRILFLDISSAFNTIQPPMLQDKLNRMEVDPHPVAWISSYLTDRPQYVRLKDTTSDTVVSSWPLSLPRTPRTSATTQSCVTYRSTPMTQPSLDASGTTERRSIGVWWGTLLFGDGHGGGSGPSRVPV